MVPYEAMQCNAIETKTNTVYVILIKRRIQVDFSNLNTNLNPPPQKKKLGKQVW